ncbi:MAG: adenosylcobinamide-GDP ribazoletransferase, partial [Thermoleophilia bacterium]
MTARRAARALAGGASAVTFLTIAPLGRRAPRSGKLGPAAAWFPLVGGAVGLAAGGLRAGADPLVGAVPATVLAVIAGVVLTGGLHQDGLADCADGLGARGGLERRLAVMRDPVVGAFGVLALIAWALIVVTSVGGLTTGRAVIALVTAGALGRLAAVGHALACRPARADGLSAGFAPSGSGAALATASAAV